MQVISGDSLAAQETGLKFLKELHNIQSVVRGPKGRGGAYLRIIAARVGGLEAVLLQYNEVMGDGITSMITALSRVFCKNLVFGGY